MSPATSRKGAKPKPSKGKPKAARRPAARAAPKAKPAAARKAGKAAKPTAKGAAPAKPAAAHCAASDPFGDPCQNLPRRPSRYCVIHSYLDR